MNDEKKQHLEHEAQAGAAGAVIGAVLGSIAGPPGAIAGAVLGAAAGAMTEAAAESGDAAETVEDEKLDDAIGVSTGEMGAPNLKHPPAKVGAYSGASSGAAQAESEESADGPMQRPSS